MPELPEVEVTRLGLAPTLVGRTVTAVVARRATLRYPLPGDLKRRIVGRALAGIARRAKYLLLDFGNGHVLIHLGMSGTLRILPSGTPPGKHDHVDLVFGEVTLRLRDPRRFGALLWIEGDPAGHPLLARLGIEPLNRRFTPRMLAQYLAGSRVAIKPALMDAGRVVGIGNIYASESLFHAGIDPRTPAGRVGPERLGRLVPAIKKVLRAAIRAGGSSLRDFFRCDGEPGYFQQQYFVYDRAGEPCRRCSAIVRSIRQGNRATYFCPHCQR